jgi:hypothetical protein
MSSSPMQTGMPMFDENQNDLEAERCEAELRRRKELFFEILE